MQQQPLLTPKQSITRLIKKANGAWRDAGTRNGGYRVQPTRLTDPTPPEHLLLIATGLGMKITRTIPPGAAGSCSGKYKTYLVRDPKCQSPWKLVCGSGGNGGHKFEQEVLRSFKSLMNGKSVSKYPAGMKMAKAICAKLRITNPKVQIVAVSHVGKSNTSRQIDFAAKPPGIGSAVADLAVMLSSGKIRYISLKAQNAGTVASIGAVGSFRQSGNKIIQTAKHQTVNNLLSYLGVDVARFTRGLTNAKNKTRTKMARSSMVLFDTTSGIKSSHRKLLRRFLVNSLGFGYYAASQNSKQQSSVKFIDRRMVERMVGSTIKQVVLSYPRHYSVNDNSKQLSAWVTTNKTRFKIELRNTHGEVLPREIKVSLPRLHDVI